MARYDKSLPGFIALAVIMGLGSILAVVLRIVARRHSKSALGLDDAFAVVAMCGCLAFLGIMIWGNLSLGICKHTLIASLESLNGFMYGFPDVPLKVLQNDLKVCRLLRTIK